MRCNDFHDRVNDLLDERLEPSQDPAVRDHVKSCDACRAVLAGYQLLMNRGAQPSTNQPQDTRPPTATFWLTIAATILIATAFFPRSNQTQTAQTETTQNAPNVIAPIAAVEEDSRINHFEPVVQPLMMPPSTSVVVDRVVANGHFVQPILSFGYMAQADWSGVSPLAMPFGVQVPTVEAKWIQVVADEMVPIQQSVNSTVDLIVRTLSTSA